jgi:hypothetical protein
MSRRTRTILGRVFLALSAISFLVGIATGAWDTVLLAVVGIAGGLLLLNVRGDGSPRAGWRVVAPPLAIGSLALVAAMIALQSSVAPFALAALLVLVGAAVAYQQLRRT